MEKYILSCCSTADLTKEHFEAIDVKYICFHYELDGVEYQDDLGQTIEFEDFYRRMAAGADTKTSQVNADEFEAYFESFLRDGYDILHVCLSSVFSEESRQTVFHISILEEAMTVSTGILTRIRFLLRMRMAMISCLYMRMTQDL